MCDSGLALRLLLLRTLEADNCEDNNARGTCMKGIQASFHLSVHRHGQTQAERRTHGQAERRTDRQAERRTHGHTQTERKTHRQAQTERRTHGQAERRTHGQTQTERRTHDRHRQSEMQTHRKPPVRPFICLKTFFCPSAYSADCRCVYNSLRPSVRPLVRTNLYVLITSMYSIRPAFCPSVLPSMRLFSLPPVLPSSFLPSFYRPSFHPSFFRPFVRVFLFVRPLTVRPYVHPSFLPLFVGPSLRSSSVLSSVLPPHLSGLSFRPFFFCLFFRPSVLYSDRSRVLASVSSSFL